MHNCEDASYYIFFVILKLWKRTQERGSDKLTHLGAKSDGNLVSRFHEMLVDFSLSLTERVGRGELKMEAWSGGLGSQDLSFAASSSSWPLRTVRPEAFQSVKSTIS